MLHTGGVDETVFAQILNAYRALNPSELIPNDAYDACLARMGADGKGDGTATEEIPMIQTGAELQQRFGAKLFVKERDDGERVLVSGTKKRNLELIPIRRVYSTLKELAQDHHYNATQLKHAIKAKVLGIPEEIVQEYCEMAVSAATLDDMHVGREKEEFKRCATCGVTKSYKSFAKNKEKVFGLRPRCKACESKLTAEEPSEFINDVLAANDKPSVKSKRKKKESYNGLTGTAICAACGDRKPVSEFDKARQKPFTLKCRSCAALNAPLMTKICCSCQLDLTLDHFYRDSYTKAGFRPRCMDCMKAQKGIQIIPEDTPVNEDELDTRIYQQKTLNPEPEILYSKSTRSQRDRRKSHKSRETEGMDALEADGVEITEPRNRFRRKKKTRQTRRGGPKREKAISNSAEEEHTKLAALSSLSVRGNDERRKADTSPSPLTEKEHSTNGRPRGLTGCLTDKGQQGNVTKYCTGCQNLKKADEFGRDVSKPSRLRSRCRKCQKRGRDFAAANGTVIEEQLPNGTVDALPKKTPRKPIRKKTTIEEKICARCDHQKPIVEFYRDKSKEDSYASICKRCAREAKAKSEKATAKKAAITNATFSKVRQGRVNDVEDEDIEAVMRYIDALAPESSAYSGNASYDEIEEAETTSHAQHRVCIGCKMDKSWIEFDANPLLPDGLCPLCKECRRGNGLKGRRLSGKELKRCCLRCGLLKPAMQFAKSIFYPNRTSRICKSCRGGSKDLTGGIIAFAKRRRTTAADHVEAMDLMDFEFDLLRVGDPGGGEQFWNGRLSESDSEPRSSNSTTPTIKACTLQTQLRFDGPKSLTVTHRIPVDCSIPQPRMQQIDEQSIQQAWRGFDLSAKRNSASQLLKKQCKRCGEMKSKDAYYVDASQFSQLSSNCVQCSMAIADMAT